MHVFCGSARAFFSLATLRGHAVPEKKNGTRVSKKRRPFSEHRPDVQLSRGPILGSVFRTPFFRVRSEGERKCGLRPSRFQRKTLAGFEEAAAHIPAARPTRNPLIPASQRCGVCGWSRGVTVGSATRCHVLSPDCGVTPGQPFAHVLVADPSKKVPFPAKGSGRLQGLHTDSGRRLEWIFMPTSDAFFFPLVHSVRRARLQLRFRARVRSETVHGHRGIMLLQMQQTQRNLSEKHHTRCDKPPPH